MIVSTPRAVWVLALLALLVVLGGCLGGGTSTTDGPPTDAVTDPTATDGVVNDKSDDGAPASAATQHPLAARPLAESHRESLRGANSFTMNYSLSMTQTTEAETRHLDVRWHASADLDRDVQLLHVTTSGFDDADADTAVQADVYVDGETAYQRSTVGDTVQYARANATEYDVSAYLTGMQSITQLDPNESTFTYEGPTAVDGEVRHVYTATKADLEQQYVPRGATQQSRVETDSISELEIRLLVDGVGVLRGMTYDLEVTAGNSTTTLHMELSYSDVGSTVVEEPDWLANASTAPANTA